MKRREFFLSQSCGLVMENQWKLLFELTVALSIIRSLFSAHESLFLCLRVRPLCVTQVPEMKY